MLRYSPKEKREMVELYFSGKTFKQVALSFGCASSTVFYAVHPDKYEAHKEYMRIALRKGVKN